MEKYIERINNAKTFTEIREILSEAWEDEDVGCYTDLIDYFGIEF